MISEGQNNGGRFMSKIAISVALLSTVFSVIVYFSIFCLENYLFYIMTILLLIDFVAFFFISKKTKIKSFTALAKFDLIYLAAFFSLFIVCFIVNIVFGVSRRFGFDMANGASLIVFYAFNGIFLGIDFVFKQFILVFRYLKSRQNV